ncbi:D-sedoheptulose-7-phosphate isomerase [Sunxiuqinia sp. A32]|uniref:D-sedoheptulose-7-phosphate isomerase n=1 Tax=Sunxiuqinia sp. A32 TaxID=3461496 RepID=UPI0040467F28
MIRDRIKQSISLKENILRDDKLISNIEKAAEALIACYQRGNKTLFCGNGGSAADAQHLAAELSGKFYLDRPPIHAEACHVNSSFITAYSNDYHFENAYERYVASTGKKGDVFIAISTSGNSINIINAAKKAKDIGMFVVALTGETGGDLKAICDILINVPSSNTARIQEAQILIGHIICEITEQKLFGE